MINMNDPVIFPIPVEWAQGFVKYHRPRHTFSDSSHQFAIACGLNQNPCLCGVAIFEIGTNFTGEVVALVITSLCTDGTQGATELLCKTVQSIADAMGCDTVVQINH